MRRRARAATTLSLPTRCSSAQTAPSRSTPAARGSLQSLGRIHTSATCAQTSSRKRTRSFVPLLLLPIADNSLADPFATSRPQNPHCIFCPPGKPPLPLNKSHKKSLYPDEPNYLQTLKPTNGSNGWAHVLCATFVPGARFTDTSAYSKVEGVHLVEREAWTGVCSLCNKRGGATIKCNDCPKLFHVACGMTRGFKFGFEISLVSLSVRSLGLSRELTSSGVAFAGQDHASRRCYGRLIQGGDWPDARRRVLPRPRPQGSTHLRATPSRQEPRTGASSLPASPAPTDFAS